MFTYRATNTATLCLLELAAQWMQRPAIFSEGDREVAMHGSSGPQLELLQLSFHIERDTV